MKEKWKIFWQMDWSPTEKALLLIDALLAGVLLGWLTSPLRSKQFFCNNAFGGSAQKRETAEDEE